MKLSTQEYSLNTLPDGTIILTAWEDTATVGTQFELAEGHKVEILELSHYSGTNGPFLAKVKIIGAAT
jgi:hypothetical protein